MADSDEEMVDWIFFRLKEQIPRHTIERVLKAYAWYRVIDAIDGAGVKNDA